MAQYNVNNIMVSSLLSSIRDGTIAIPEIQRPFVWDPTKVRDLIDSLYPEITLETDDFIMSISVKKDYSKINDLDKRKQEFINDLHEFINEFSETPESKEFMAFFD